MRREITDTLAGRYRDRVQAAAEQAGPPARVEQVKPREAETSAPAVQPATVGRAAAAEHSAATEPPATAGPAAAPSISAVIEEARRMGREAFVAQRQQAAEAAAHGAEHAADQANKDATEDAGAARVTDEDLAL